MIYDIKPVPKPRMTQRDRWAKRPAVLRYREFCDQVRAAGVEVPESGARLTFTMPMPASWSKKKREEMDGQPHQQRPDVDNLCKAVLDAIFDEDSHIWDIRCTKVWGVNGSISVDS